jgi:hypothetical protein
MQEGVGEREHKMEEVKRMRVRPYQATRQRLLPQNKLRRRVRGIRQSNSETLVRRSFRKAR